MNPGPFCPRACKEEAITENNHSFLPGLIWELATKNCLSCPEIDHSIGAFVLSNLNKRPTPSEGFFLDRISRWNHRVHTPQWVIVYALIFACEFESSKTVFLLLLAYYLATTTTPTTTTSNTSPNITTTTTTTTTTTWSSIRPLDQ